MAGKSTATKAPAKASTKSAEKAAPAAAPAAAEQLDNQPAAITDNAAPIPVPPPTGTVQPASAAPGLEAGSEGQDAPTIIVLGGHEIAGYLDQLKAAGAIGIGTGDLIPLNSLPEPLLRQVGQFVEIEGHDVLPPEQLVSMIEAKVGLAPSVTVAPGAAVSDTPVLDAAAAAVLAAAADDTLGDDGDIEGLWIVAIPEQGFRRCGFRFTREGLAIALSALTEQQIEQLENEPNLKVERGIFGGRVGVQ